MRLTRIGSKKRPYFRIVVIDKRRARNGRFLEVLGQYNPMANPAQMEINSERAQYWLSKGAQPSETVQSILRKKELVKYATYTPCFGFILLVADSLQPEAQR